MATFTAFNLYTLHHLQHISPLSTSSSSSSSSSLSFFDSLSSLPLRNPFQPKLSHHGYYDVLAPRASASLPNSSTSRNDHETTSPAKTNAITFKQRKQQTGTGYSSTNSAVETLTKNSVKAEPHSERRITRRTRGYRDRRGSTSWYAKPSGSGTSSSSHKVNERYKIKEDENMVQKQNTGKNARKKKDQDSSGVKLRVALDMCSKRGDVMGALSLYDSARADGVKLGQHHYTVLLYLCSSAAVGVVRPAKSGTGVRTLNASVSSPNEAVTNHVDFNGSVDRSDGYGGDVAKSHGMFGNAELNYASDGEASEIGEANPVANGDSSFVKDASSSQEYHGIAVSEDVKKYALQRGFEIYESMCLDKVQMNEAALTSVARMAMSVGDGDMAFEMVKQMKIMGINPRLRSYGPALSTYCNNGDIDKAVAVEKHMLEHGVYPEEPELEALLRVSIQASKGDKVYYVLHKLRSSVRKVSPPTAALIIDWFNGTKASRLGKRKLDIRSIKQAIENNGGGWHGQGWLGKGKWEVSHTTIRNDGICKCCGVHLATIDLDPIETEKFAESVKSIAMMREKRSNFEKFQKWLDYYGPFEAVVDAANVGLFGQRSFMPSKINAVVNGIRQKLPSKKFPLIVLHNKRIKGDKMDRPINRALIDRWNNADALYATPTGSNDDWYWLYAAIKFKCLIVTNDEMRDHLFQLLGNDFFPKWKERHQVRFSFSDTGPEFYMPPPCSVVIQESEQGHWHIPIETEINYESERRWLCITRPKSEMACNNS